MIPSQALKDQPQMMSVFFWVAACDEEVINVITEMQSVQNLVDELFERLFSIPQTKGHLHEFKESKRTGYGCFRDV